MIVNHIRNWALTQPEKSAVISNDAPSSYASFARAIEATRRHLERFDLPAGKNVIVPVDNLRNAWVIILALRMLGLNTIAMTSLDQLEAMQIRDIACIVIAEGRRHMDHLARSVSAGVKAISVPEPVYADRETGDLPEQADGSRPIGGHVLLTSGTTGYYKKVFIDGATDDKRIRQRLSRGSVVHETVHHSFDLGPWTAGGYRTPLTVWQVGGTIIFDQRPKKFEHFINDKITATFCTPPMVKSLLDARGSLPPPDYEFDMSISGGFISSALAEAAIEKFNAKLHIVFSSTEVGGSLARSNYVVPEDLFWLTPPVHRAIQIVDENGDLCPTGAEGELRVRLMDIDATHYVDDEETSSQFFRDGFFYTGDMAVARADGRVRILGRSVDSLNMRGRKVAPAPVEHMVQQILGVDEVCLFTGMDTDGNEELVIAVQSDREPPQSAGDRIMSQFPHFDRIRFVAVKEFPRTQAGMRKVRRNALRQMIFSKTEKSGIGPGS
jgi:acyl-coenzyme A synthetase/AMP-(fatty) acid ligase